jgi:hypothetical protein
MSGYILTFADLVRPVISTEIGGILTGEQVVIPGALPGRPDL